MNEIVTMLTKEEKTMNDSEYINYYESFRSRGFMQLKEIQTIAEVSRLFNIPKMTLMYRLKYLSEGVEYKKLGERQPVLLSPKGVEKLLNIKEVEL
jgi:Fic family protein